MTSCRLADRIVFDEQQQRVFYRLGPPAKGKLTITTTATLRD